MMEKKRPQLLTGFPGMDGAALTGCEMEVFFWDVGSGGLLED
jgi:hypothetical protein